METLLKKIFQIEKVTTSADGMYNIHIEDEYDITMFLDTHETDYTLTKKFTPFELYVSVAIEDLDKLKPTLEYLGED